MSSAPQAPPVPKDKKTVLVTGCSPGGIGYALALAFHARGFHVFATARTQSALSTLTSHGLEALDLEVTSATSIASTLSHVTTRTNGTLDYLINNAGRNYTLPALDISIAEASDVFATNVLAVMALCQAFVPLLIAAKGSIINIGSLAAVMPYVFGSVYNASKAALHSYSDTLRVELAPLGVKVVVVVAGGVKSQLARLHRELPEGSRYRGVKAEYERRQVYSLQGAMETEVFAERVVGDLLGFRERWLGGRRMVWRGNQAWKVWFLGMVMPRVFWDWIFSRMFGLWKIGEKGKGEEKRI